MVIRSKGVDVIRQKARVLAIGLSTSRCGGLDGVEGRRWLCFVKDFVVRCVRNRVFGALEGFLGGFVALWVGLFCDSFVAHCLWLVGAMAEKKMFVGVVFGGSEGK